MKNESIEELTDQLQQLLIHNHNEEQKLISKINRIKENNGTEKHRTNKVAPLEVSEQVTYSTNGTRRHSNHGIIVRLTKHRVVIRDTNGKEIYRAAPNVHRT